MSQIAICDENGQHVVGYADKTDAHARGLWHRTVVLILVRTGKLLLYRRGPDQHPGDCWDILGGHEDLSDGCIRRTGWRELSEEVIATLDGVRFDMPAEDLQLLGTEGCLKSDAPHNREFTTPFGIAVPDQVQIQVQDDGDAGVVKREHRFATLGELLKEMRMEPAQIADGLQRLLEAISRDQLLRCAVYQLVGHREWLISFACTKPGEPGCGCPDGDFSAEHHFKGTLLEAEAAARQISFEWYSGDFLWWIEPVTTEERT